MQPADLDDLNHVNNTVYLTWCEQVARQHALSLGLVPAPGRTARLSVTLHL